MVQWNRLRSGGLGMRKRIGLNLYYSLSEDWASTLGNGPNILLISSPELTISPLAVVNGPNSSQVFVLYINLKKNRLGTLISYFLLAFFVNLLAVLADSLYCGVKSS